MKRLALLLFAAHVSAQIPLGGITGSTAAPCTPPTMTYLYSAFNTSNTCNGGSPCTNGDNMDTIKSSATANDGTAASSGARPLYNTNQINGQPALTLNGPTNQQGFGMATAIPTGSGSLTLYAVIKPDLSGGQAAIIGNGSASGGGTAGIKAIEWRINNSTSKQDLLSQQNALLASSTSTVSTAAFSTVAVTYDFGTGAYTFYKCASGTCTADGSGTASGSWAVNSSGLGLATSASEFYKGQIAEWGYLNSASVTGIAAWSQCKYGI